MEPHQTKGGETVRGEMIEGHMKALRGNKERRERSRRGRREERSIKQKPRATSAQ